MVRTTRRPAARAERHLAALDAAVRGIAGIESVDRVLQLIVDRVRELVGAEYAALGIVATSGTEIEQFITSGVDAAARPRIGHIPRGLGLLGLIIRENRAFRIPDIATDPRRHGFPPNHPAMHAFLGVPVTVRGRSVGNLYLTNKRGEQEFSADDQRLVEMFALHAGIAIENARLHEQVQRLAVIEERERIGRDLHDGIIQSIYAVTLSLEDVAQLFEEAPDEAARLVEIAIDSLQRTTREIRDFVFALRPGLLEDDSLAGALGRLAADLRRTANLHVEVTAAQLIALPLATAWELLAIAREALSNVARHADAGRAAVMLSVREGEVRLEIADDGRGFDPGEARAGTHQGLSNMHDRAAGLGGRLELVSAPGAGTRIIAAIPAPRD